MKKVRIFALIGLALGMGTAVAGFSGNQCQQFCIAQYNDCRAAATNLEERAACFEARYECYAQCH